MSSHELTRGIVHQLLIDDVIPDPTQPRQTFLAKPLEELAESIKSRGVLQPITVVQSGAQFIIKMGERRWRAAKLAGLETIPALIDIAGGDAGDLAIDQLAENDLREGLNPIERATTFQRIKDEQGLSVKALAELLERHGMKMSRPAVSNTMRLLKLPEKARDLVAAGTLKESYARLLLPYADYPQVIDDIANQIQNETDEYVDENYVVEVILGALLEHGTKLGDSDGCDKCPCRVNAKNYFGRKIAFCMDPDKIEAKREKAAGAQAPKNQEAAAKPVETDPTKAKPVKVTPNKDGVVPLARRNYDSYKHLDRADFDKSDCEGCPHRHLASHNGSPDFANAVCFHPPCFENLERQHAKIERRHDSVRELIDRLLLPVLIETCATEPVSQALALPLLAYVAADFPADETHPQEDPLGYDAMYMHTARPDSYGNGRSSNSNMRKLPRTLGRTTLSAFLEPELAYNDCSEIVEAVIHALDIEQRRELAQYMSIDIASFWENSEEYAKLFTKPEIIALIGDKFDPPDVPAGEWRSRLADRPGVPDLVLEVWNSPIANILHPDESGDGVGRFAA